MNLVGNRRGGCLKLVHLGTMITSGCMNCLASLPMIVAARFRKHMPLPEERVASSSSFSSVWPPETENVSIADFEAAIDRLEKRLGLKGQARSIAFHEKNGRRHAHAVWSHIDAIEKKAISLLYYHNRPKEVSKDLFLKHDWRLHDGMKDKRNWDSRNFSLAEW